MFTSSSLAGFKEQPVKEPVKPDVEFSVQQTELAEKVNTSLFTSKKMFSEEEIRPIFKNGFLK